MNNLFTEMIIPQLGDGNFQANFEDFCNAMKQNIERLISVQYTKGEPGNSVYTRNVHVGYSESNDLTNISANLLNTIFGTNIFNTDMTSQDVNNALEGTDANIMVDYDYFTSGGIAPSIVVDGVEYKVIPSFMNNYDGIDIEINIDDITGVAYLASPYIFIDNRIAGLNQMVRNHSKDDEIYKIFHDFSVAIYGRGEYDSSATVRQDPEDPATWTWTFDAVQIVPKLYFDENINEFCWNVNGQETGITAQGIKGDDGVSPNMIIAIGTRNDGDPTIQLNKIQVIDEFGDINWATQNNNIWGYVKDGDFIEIEQPKYNDLVLVFFSPAHTQDGDIYENAFLGKVYFDESGIVYTYIGFDEDGRCDIFESIRLHDYWNLMMTINSNSTGAPRGYLLPADPGQSPINPSTRPNKVHMTYSEKTNQDNNGFGKLHSSPILRGSNPDPTQMSQTENPPANHIGDWQVDYNMDVRGNMEVQGNMNIQGSTNIFGETTIHNNTSVQGNLEVQGLITGGSFTITGYPFETTILTPKLACLSRFKDVAYSLRRSIDSVNKRFSYSIVISGTLELNIGVLSAFNDNSCIFAPHEAISGYGPNWDSTGSYSGASSLDGDQTRAFESTGCNGKSKLYNVVKYEIPFDLTKNVTSNPLYSSVETRPNIFGYADISDSIQWRNAPQTRSCFKNVRGNISLRFVSTGFNIKTFLPIIGSHAIIKGCDIKKTTDTDGILAYNINPSCTNLISDSTVSVNNTRVEIETQESQKGIIRCITDHADSQRNTSSSTENDYSIHGKINYAPYNMNIEYYFDLFTRIFELDYSSWKTYTNDSNTYFCNEMNFNILLDIVPMGFVSCKYGTPQREYHAPIWNAINVNNEGSNSIRSNIFVISSSSHQFFPSQSTDENELYTIDNSLISNKFTKSYTQESSTNTINGPQSTILNGENIISQYIIGVFDCPIATTGNNRIGCITPENCLQANYFDITPSLRMVENNIKVCPNNLNMGVWKLNSSGNAIEWKLAEPIPLSIIPYEGYIGSYNASNNAGKVKIGCCNFKSASTSDGSPVVFNGILIYPFTPCLIMNPLTAQSITDSQNDANFGGSHKISHARMMGITDGSVLGTITMTNNSNSTDVPADWSGSMDQPTTNNPVNPELP